MPVCASCTRLKKQARLDLDAIKRVEGEEGMQGEGWGLRGEGHLP